MAAFYRKRGVSVNLMSDFSLRAATIVGGTVAVAAVAPTVSWGFILALVCRQYFDFKYGA